MGSLRPDLLHLRKWSQQLNTLRSKFAILSCLFIYVVLVRLNSLVSYRSISRKTNSMCFELIIWKILYLNWGNKGNIGHNFENA